jgi:hypothetical protein
MKLERLIFDVSDQSSESINALAQCKNTSLTVISTHVSRVFSLESKSKYSATIEKGW